jgi:putative tricarboxylic transport membrane protein
VGLGGALAMKHASIAAAVILLGLAGFILFEVRKLPLGSLRVPQTALFPATLAVLLLLFSLAVLVLAFRQSGSAPGPAPQRIDSAGWSRIGATLVALVGFALVLEWIGYLPSTFILMVLLLRAIEAQKWLVVFSVALLTSLLSYFLFAWLLGVPLPAGALGL